MLKLLRLIVLALAAYGTKALYEQYFRAARADGSGEPTAERIKQAAQGVSRHANQAARDVAEDAQVAAQQISRDVIDHMHDAAQEVRRAPDDTAAST